MEPTSKLAFFTTTFVSLFIIMDPIGNLPFFLLFTDHCTRREQIRIAAEAAFASAVILILFVWGGDAILNFFDISIPAFQIAGGFIFFLYALQMLQLLPTGMKTSAQEEEESLSRENVALVPIATPLLAGPGAITAVLVWRHSYTGGSYSWLIILATVLVCCTIFLTFSFGTYIRKTLGLSGIKVLSRIMGLLLAVLAVQFMVNGFVGIVSG